LSFAIERGVVPGPSFLQRNLNTVSIACPRFWYRPASRRPFHRLYKPRFGAATRADRLRLGHQCKKNAVFEKWPSHRMTDSYLFSSGSRSFNTVLTPPVSKPCCSIGPCQRCAHRSSSPGSPDRRVARLTALRPL